MDKDRKIEIQQQELLRLDNENTELKNQISELNKQVSGLKDQLEIEKNKPKEGYERAKQMIRELEVKQLEYIEIIDSLKELQEKYNTEIEQVRKVREEYQDKIELAMYNITSAINKM